MRSTFVPKNLDMMQFGDKADKVALILNEIYRRELYKNTYGYKRRKNDFTKPVTLNMRHLKMILKESASPILDLICRSYRHDKSGTQPIKKVLKRVHWAKTGICAAAYVLTEEYRVKPKIHRLRRTTNPVFKYNKAKMDEVIAGFPENYQTVCNSVRILRLEMDETKCKELIRQMRERYIEKDR